MNNNQHKKKISDEKINELFKKSKQQQTVKFLIYFFLILILSISIIILIIFLFIFNVQNKNTKPPVNNYGSDIIVNFKQHVVPFLNKKIFSDANTKNLYYKENGYGPILNFRLSLNKKYLNQGYKRILNDNDNSFIIVNYVDGYNSNSNLNKNINPPVFLVYTVYINSSKSKIDNYLNYLPDNLFTSKNGKTKYNLLSQYRTSYNDSGFNFAISDDFVKHQIINDNNETDVITASTKSLKGSVEKIYDEIQGSYYYYDDNEKAAHSLPKLDYTYFTSDNRSEFGYVFNNSFSIKITFGSSPQTTLLVRGFGLTYNKIKQQIKASFNTEGNHSIYLVLKSEFLFSLDKNSTGNNNNSYIFAHENNYIVEIDADGWNGINGIYANKNLFYKLSGQAIINFKNKQGDIVNLSLEFNKKYLFVNQFINISNKNINYFFQIYFVSEKPPGSNLSVYFPCFSIYQDNESISKNSCLISNITFKSFKIGFITSSFPQVI